MEENKEYYETPIKYDKDIVKNINIEVEKIIQDKIKNNDLRTYETEEEFNLGCKKYKKRFNKIIRSGIKYIKEPYKLILDFELLLQEMTYSEVVSEVWAQSQRERLFREMNSPNEFKEWIRFNKIKLEEKIKSYIK